MLVGYKVPGMSHSRQRQDKHWTLALFIANLSPQLLVLVLLSPPQPSQPSLPAPGTYGRAVGTLKASLQLTFIVSL